MGYDEKFQAKVIQATLTGYERQCELVDESPTPCTSPGSLTRRTGKTRS